MRLATPRTALILLPLLWCFMFSPVCAAAKPSVQTFLTVNDALAAIRSTYGVSTGVELLVGHEDRSPITLDLSAKDVTNAFNELVRQRPSFTWSLQDGVYALFPKTGTDSITQLELRQYSLNNETLAEASLKISKLPEFKKWLATRRVARRELQVGRPWRSDQRISLALNNVRMRAVLNQLIKNFGMKQWIVVRYGDSGEYLAIYFYNH